MLPPGGFHPTPKRSIPTVKQAIYRWFKKYLNINLHGNGIIYIQNVVLNNFKVFSELFDDSIREYKPIKELEIQQKIEELEEWNEDWEISENRNFNPNSYRKYDNFKLNVFNPCYLNLDSNIEEDFIKYLETKKEKVEWWYQNGNEHMALNFGIKYNKKSTFQPDFIVKFKNGKLGIFDTKASGDREDENKLKGEALQKYIDEENLKGKNLFGGLIIKEGEHFRINSEKEYVSFKESKDNWNFIDF